MPSSSPRSMAASRAGTAPSGTTLMPSGPQPCCCESLRVSQSVSEPSVVTPMLLPLRSATVRIGERDSTQSARFAGGPYMAATPIAGTPLARKPRPGPEPTAMSTAPAVSACCIWASPRNADTASSTFSCSQILASVPTSAVLKANELGTDFPNLTLSSAKASRAARIMGAARVPATTLRLEITRRLEIVRILYSPDLRAPMLSCRMPTASRPGFFRPADVGIAIHRQSFLTKRIKISQCFFVTHVFRHVVGFAMHHVGQRPAHARTGGHIGITDRHDQVEGDERRHAEHFLKRLLDVNCSVLAAEVEGGSGEMHHHGGVGEPVGEMRLPTPEGVGALHGRPLAAPIAQDHDQHRRPRPAVSLALLLDRALLRHLIGGVAQLEVALLFHPVDEVGVLLDVDAEQIRLDLRVLHHHEFPGLAVRPGHRPATDFENPFKVFVGNRIGLELAHADAIAHELQQRVVVA